MSAMVNVRKKLREAHFFLGEMIEREHMAFGDREKFDFYLSAFLNATRTVDYRLRHEQGSTYRTFRAAWDASRSADDQQLIKFLVDDRNLEVHESGSTRTEEDARIVVGNSYSDRSGKMMVFAPPGIQTEIMKPVYYFLVGGQKIRAIDYCRRYIDLLERMVQDYCQQHSIV